MALSIGVIGSGTVGRVLAAGFAGKGHAVTLGTREPGKLSEWSAAAGAAVRVADVAGAAKADVVIVAVAGAGALSAIAAAGSSIHGKVVIDACNPIAGPPVDGWIPYFTGPDSLMERLQAASPEARFVKAFSSVGNALMIDPQFTEGRPTMFICGNDEAAKATVAELLDEVGWDAEDMGKAQAARGIEALCQLWCARGFVQGKWNHAFKLVKG